MAPEIMTSDFVKSVLAEIERLETNGVSSTELVHAVMFVIAILCQNYEIPDEQALELQHSMLRKCNIIMGGSVVVDGGAEA